jgi:hypothetical protein
MKNNKYLTEEQINEKIESLFINESAQLNEWFGLIRNLILTPASIFAKRTGKILQSGNPAMRLKADELYHGYTNAKGKWVPGLKDRHPALKPLPAIGATAGYYGAEAGLDTFIDAFTNKPKVTKESNIGIKNNDNVIVEAGHILDTLHDLELVEQLVINGSMQLNEVKFVLSALNWLSGLGSKAAIKAGDKLIKLGTKTPARPASMGNMKPPGNVTPLTKAELKIDKQQVKADKWSKKIKDDTVKGSKGFSDEDLHAYQTINKSSLISKGLSPLALGAQIYLYKEYGPWAMRVAGDMTGATDFWDLARQKYYEYQHKAEVQGDRELFGMDPKIKIESSGTNNIMLDEFSNVICEADMIPDDTMRNYIDIINGNSLNEGVLSWVANKLAASPKKFSSDDFDELLKDTDVTVIVKTRDRLAQSIQNAGADPALSNEIKTLDNIISQRINNSRK